MFLLEVAFHFLMKPPFFSYQNCFFLKKISGYPVKHPKQARYKVLEELSLPAGTKALFLGGSRDKTFDAELIRNAMEASPTSDDAWKIVEIEGAGIVLSPRIFL